MKPISVVTFVFAIVTMACNTHDSYKLLDNDPPLKVPKLFAEGTVSQPGRYEQYCSFSPNGNEMYLSITDQHWNYLGVFSSKFENGQWTKLDTAEFCRHGLDGGEPFAYNNALYFVSVRHHDDPWHTDIYEVDRAKNKMGETTRLPFPLNSQANEWHPTFTTDGVMYFGSERNNEQYKADIYRSVFKDGTFDPPVKLSDSINTPHNDCDPLISPDESFLIFHSDRPDGFGEHDLYISFKKDDGSWSKSKNMGSAINSPEWELGPSLSPDGKYLFFTRRESFQTNKPSKIYWVSMDVVEDLK